MECMQLHVEYNPLCMETTPGENTGMYHIWKALHLLADACDTLAQFHSIDLTGPYTDPAREHADIAYKGHYVA